MPIDFFKILLSLILTGSSMSSKSNLSKIIFQSLILAGWWSAGF